MATIENHEENIIDSIPKEMEKKKKRRRRSKKTGVETGSTSSGNGSPPPSKSRKQQRRRSTNHQVIEEPILSQEEKSKYISIDCEMVGIGVYGQQSCLARVVLVDYDGNKVLDVFVQPTEPVTDYRTFVSGITPDDLNSPNAVSFEECRLMVKHALYKKVLVGHALRNDMVALRLSHPWYDTRDTGRYEPFMKDRFNDGILWPRKLKELVKNKLNRDIQLPGCPHCPEEDAKAAMDLYKHARRKWEKAMEYKINKTREIEHSRKQ